MHTVFVDNLFFGSKVITFHITSHNFGLLQEHIKKFSTQPTREGKKCLMLSHPLFKYFQSDCSQNLTK